MEERASFQTYNCFVLHAIEVNPIVVPVKFTTSESAQIAATKSRPKNRPQLLRSAQVQRRKEHVVKIKPPIEAVVVICTNQFLNDIKQQHMSKNVLFAIDPATAEVIVSESPKGSNSIQFIERIARKENEILFQAVTTLTHISTAATLDVPIFKAMDKVCQLIYEKHK